MRYLALATDYDGTIAHDGAVDLATVESLRQLKSTGRKLVMVTGRELDQLLEVCNCLDLFDMIIAENGAVLYTPGSKVERTLAEPPPAEFVSRLRGENLPMSVGRVIVATWVGHEHQVLSAIHDLGLGWHVIFNKNAVMALPEGVTKATGLSAALQALDLRPEQVVAVGDAENDHAFLAICGVAAAVGNAIPSVKDRADVVLEGARGAGVAELIGRMLADDLAGVGRG